MTRRNFIILYIGILLFFLALTSCGSKKQCVVLPSDFKGPKELSRLYGVRLTPNDNIFLYNEGARWLGVPHRMGGLTKKGVDCSGLVCNIYKNVYHLSLERTVIGMYKKNCRKISRNKLKPGDLVFFNTATKRKSISHVGIYLKKNTFIHATTASGVRLSELNEPYYKKRWIKGGRVKK